MATYTLCTNANIHRRYEVEADTLDDAWAIFNSPARPYQSYEDECEEEEDEDATAYANGSDEDEDKDEDA